MQSYLDHLDEELSKQPGFKNPLTKQTKRCTTSKTDTASGCINHAETSGISYLMEDTADCKHGVVTGVDPYPAMNNDLKKAY